MNDISTELLSSSVQDGINKLYKLTGKIYETAEVPTTTKKHNFLFQTYAQAHKCEDY